MFTRSTGMNNAIVIKYHLYSLLTRFMANFIPESRDQCCDSISCCSEYGFRKKEYVSPNPERIKKNDTPIRAL